MTAAVPVGWSLAAPSLSPRDPGRACEAAVALPAQGAKGLSWRGPRLGAVRRHLGRLGAAEAGAGWGRALQHRFSSVLDLWVGCCGNMLLTAPDPGESGRRVPSPEGASPPPTMPSAWEAVQGLRGPGLAAGRVQTQPRSLLALPVVPWRGHPNVPSSCRRSSWLTGRHVQTRAQAMSHPSQHPGPPHCPGSSYSTRFVGAPGGPWLR